MSNQVWYASDLAQFYWHEMIENYSLTGPKIVEAAMLYYLWKDIAFKLYSRNK